jgi:hypothetical protein
VPLLRKLSCLIPAQSAERVWLEYRQWPFTTHGVSPENRFHLMNALDLDRHFVPLKPDGETIDWGASTVPIFGGRLRWDELITRRRVVLLAEAKSGKTEEFRLRVSALCKQGEAAFFLRVEDLADGALIEGLTPEHEASLTAWQGGDAIGWFFLDSVDEARLNAKRFESALKRFRRDVGAALDRAHVFISCRVSDWKGKQDRDLVTSLLPIPLRRSSEAEVASIDDLLLRPMFEEQPESAKAKTGPDSEESLTIVRLAELNNEQRAALARWAGVADSDAFIQQVNRQGLDTFAERPGDLLELAEYWKAHGEFASFAEMTRFAIAQKLAERDSDRRDADILTDNRARHGAESIAAALTVGKKLTLRVSDQDPDPMLAAGALDPADILPDWTPSERATLLRRGVFTPATYGRIRFHHRSTQEYLTAEWLRRALDHGCPRSEVMGLLFADPYGVRTVVPSMRPAVAWLALTDEVVRNELLEREPLELIRYGDPRSLPIGAKAWLLAVYADRHRAGEITNAGVDRRSFWMFSDPALAPAIRNAWERNPDPSFRADLLALVREGTIAQCADLARAQAFDTDADPFFRSMAVAAMTACGDREGLARFADKLMSNPSALTAGDAARLAWHLFPTYLSCSDIIRLVDETQSEHQSRAGGFPSNIQELWKCCPSSERESFLEGLADLCLTPPFLEYHRVSAKHSKLASKLVPLAADIACALDAGPVPLGLLKACAAIERSDEQLDHEDLESLHDALSDLREFHRDLFWLDVQEAQRQQKRAVTRWWQLRGFGLKLWTLTIEDAEWLMARIREETVLRNRQVALSVLVNVLGKEMAHARAVELRALVAGAPELELDLARELSPPPSDPELDRHAELERRAARRNRKRDAGVKRSWLDFAARLRADSTHLRDPSRLTDWTYASDLLVLTSWLSRNTGLGKEDAARRWPLLTEVFGDEVAQAYRAGMKLLWRVTAPGPVNREDGKSNMIDWRELLSFYGIGVEADEGEGWAERLTADEAERAVVHAFFVGEGRPQWIEVLARTHPARVKPIIAREVEAEWAATTGVPRNALHGILNGGDDYFLQMADLVIDRLRERPGRVETFDMGLRVFTRLPPSAAVRVELVAHAEHELRMNGADDEWTLRQLAVLFICDGRVAMEWLEGWLAAAESDEQHKTRGERAFAALFSRHWPLMSTGLNGQPVKILARLAILAYRTICIDDDVHHEGIFTPGQRDDAESGRSRVLDALLETPGRETYDALLELAQDPSVAARRKRFRELAHLRAEQDAELPAWSAADVVAFEKRHAAPAKRGADLFRIACAILDDIKTGFLQDDASSRLVLASAADEEAVQQWLAEQFRFRSKQRFHVYREVEVADKKEPDILLSSTAAAVEVAVEVKHSGKGWTVRQLEDALRAQLVGAYLRPANRRHGILVITGHGERRWQDPNSEAMLDFDQLLGHLRRVAATLQRNDIDSVDVAVIGLDASPSRSATGARRRPSPRSP